MQKTSSGFGGSNPPTLETSFWYVYLLQCNDDTIYTGCTSNLEQRLQKHKSGGIEYTKARLPVVLINFIAFNHKFKAYKFEKYLKSGSGKAFSNKRFIVKPDEIF